MKSRTEGGCSTGGRRTTSASAYSACSRASPPPVKNALAVCAAAWLSPPSRGPRRGREGAPPPADLRHGRADRRLELLGDLMRLFEREVAGQLHVQRQLLAPVDVDQREVVHLADARHSDGGGVRALA